MRKVLLLALSVGIVAVAATPALAGKGGPKKFDGKGSGTTYVTAPTLVSYETTSGGTVKAHGPFGKLSYVRFASQDWSAYNIDTYPCATVTGWETYTDSKGNTLTTTLSGETCEVAPFDNTTYVSDLEEVITGGTDKFDGATGTLTVTGTSIATGVPGVFADSFKVKGSVSGI